MEFRVPEWKNLPAYWESHCAAFLGEPAPIAKSAREQVAIDRGGEDGEAMRAKRSPRYQIVERIATLSGTDINGAILPPNVEGGINRTPLPFWKTAY